MHQYTVNVCGAADPEHPIVSRVRGNPAFSIMKHLRCDKNCAPAFHDAGGRPVPLATIENVLDPERPARIARDATAALHHVPDGSVTIYATWRDADMVRTYYSLPEPIRAKIALKLVLATVGPTTIRDAPDGVTREALHLIGGGKVRDRDKLRMKMHLLLGLPKEMAAELVVVLPKDQDVAEAYEDLHPVWQDKVRLSPYTTALRMRTPAIIQAAGSPVSLTVEDLFALPEEPPADLVTAVVGLASVAAGAGAPTMRKP